MQQSQQHNRALNITGILLYFNGCIIQVLEGEKEHVEALYTTISRDARHTQVTPVYGRQIEKRTFSDWSIGYKTLVASEFVHLREKLPFINNPTSLTVMQDDITLAILARFYLNNRNN